MERSKIFVYFTINYCTQPGQNIWVLGSCPELGNWNLDKGLKLEWCENHEWKGSTRFEYNTSKVVEYKYVFYDSYNNVVRWEEGPNRQIEFFQLAPHKEDIFLNEVWEHRKVAIRIKYDCAEDERLLIAGNLPSLGHYRVGMGMSKVVKTDPIQKKKTTYWEKQIAVKYDKPIFYYRYCVENIKTGAQIWERESDRFCDLLNPNKRIVEKRYSDVNKKDSIAFHRKHNKYVKIDVNFVANFYFNQITENIFIGPYPQSQSDIDTMKKENIDSLLSLQTTRDMRHRKIEWSEMEKLYKQSGITAINYQILDMNPEDMELKAFEAACHLKYLCDNHKRTFVHCTAGIGRAPQTVISYLIFFKGYTLDDAINLVKAKRPITYINRDCLHRAYMRNRHRSETEVAISLKIEKDS